MAETRQRKGRLHMKKLVIGLAATAALLAAATAGAVAEKVFTVNVGDVVFVKGSRLTCSLANPYKQMACFKRTRTGHAVPFTFGTTASEKFVGIVRFNAKGNPVVIVRRDNR
jgi:hypothetical protein